jgi:hypothetical protein
VYKTTSKLDLALYCLSDCSVRIQGLPCNLKGNYNCMVHVAHDDILLSWFLSLSLLSWSSWNAFSSPSFPLDHGPFILCECWILEEWALAIPAWTGCIAFHAPPCSLSHTSSALIQEVGEFCCMLEYLHQHPPPSQQQQHQQQQGQNRLSTSSAIPTKVVPF